MTLDIWGNTAMKPWLPTDDSYKPRAGAKALARLKLVEVDGAVYIARFLKLNPELAATASEDFLRNQQLINKVELGDLVRSRDVGSEAWAFECMALAVYAAEQLLVRAPADAEVGVTLELGDTANTPSSATFRIYRPIDGERWIARIDGGGPLAAITLVP